MMPDYFIRAIEEEWHEHVAAAIKREQRLLYLDAKSDRTPAEEAELRASFECDEEFNLDTIELEYE